MNFWQSVFTRSHLNDGYHYDEDRLPEFRWEWPRGTWFQARLDYAREHGPVRCLKTAKKTALADESPTL